MAIPTVNQLAQILMREVGESSTNADLVSQFESWIQDVFDDIGIATSWRYLWNIDTLTTVDNTRVYTLSGLLDQEISAQYTGSNNTPLRLVRRQELMERGLNLSQKGKPIYWYIELYDSPNEKFTVGLFPVPDTVYTIVFLGMLQPQELTSGTKLALPRRFISTIKHGVRALSREDDKNYTGAQLARSRYKEGLDTLKKSNDAQLAHKPQMQIQDIPTAYPQFVKLPPDHFSN